MLFDPKKVVSGSLFGCFAEREREREREREMVESVTSSDPH